MEDRLNKILEHYMLSPAQLADSISVQRSSISHILSGRNKPSYDFLVKILNKYKEINANWLISGKGNMLLENEPKNRDTSFNTRQDLFSNTQQKSEKQKIIFDNTPNQEQKGTIANLDGNDLEMKKMTEFTNVNSVKSIVMIYSNNTFEIINKK